MKSAVEKSTGTKLFICLLLVVATLLTYWQLGSNGFVNYDDPSYIYENPHVNSGLSLENVRWAFTSLELSNWHPLTWISHMADCQLFGLDAGRHHFSSLFLHILTTLLVFLFFQGTTGALWRSAVVAALFALHPLHVESVAWASERKDVLSAFFWMLTLWAYAAYARRPALSGYLVVAIVFLMGLMAKTMLVTLPVILLLLDWWPLMRFTGADGSHKELRRRLVRLAIEKLPLCLMAFAVSVTSYVSQEKGGSITHSTSVFANIGNAVITCFSYLGMTFWPAKLAIFYPFDPTAHSAVTGVGATVLLLALTAVVLRVARQRPYLAVGWLWYLVALLPVIGLVRLGKHAMADRYTYIPLIGCFLMLSWGASELAARLRIKNSALAPVVAGGLLLLSIASARQVGYWRDSVTLFQHALSVTENNWLAHDNLSGAYVEQGNLVEALRQISASLMISPNEFGYAHQGWIYAQLGDYPDSIQACRRALAIAPAYDQAHLVLGKDYVALGQYRAALAEYEFLRQAGSGVAAELLAYLKSSQTAVAPTPKK